MLVTIIPADDASRTMTLVDGAEWLNHTWMDGRFLGLLKNGIEGWYDSLGTKNADIADNPAWHGGYQPNGILLDNRVLTIRGEHRSMNGPAGSVTEASFRDDLAWLAGRKATVTVTDPSGMRSATGCITSQITATVTNPLTTQFSLIVTCPDPLKYGPGIPYTLTGDGTMAVENGGNEETLPSVTVDGTPTSLELDLDGHKVTWTGNGRERLDIDFRDLLPSHGTMGDDDAFSIPPGSSTIQAKVSPQTCTITMTVRPAWR